MFELLENILIKTSEFDTAVSPLTRLQTLQDLYGFRRVNSTFRDIIARSKTLRIAMYKDLETEPVKISSSNEQVVRVEYSLKTNNLAQYYIPYREAQYHLNPLVAHLDRILPVECGHFYLSGVNKKDVGFIDGTITAERSIEETEQLAPWREMLLANRPIPFSVQLDVVTPGWTGAFCADLQSGYTVGMLVDMVIRAINVVPKNDAEESEDEDGQDQGSEDEDIEVSNDELDGEGSDRLRIAWITRRLEDE